MSVVSPLHRWVITDLSFEVVTFFDRIASNRVSTKLLDQPLQLEGTVPSWDPEVKATHSDGLPYLEEGVRCLFDFRREAGSNLWQPRGSTLIMQVNDEVSGDVPMTHFTAWDPWKYLYNRPIRTAAGGLPGSQGLKFASVDSAAPGGVGWTGAQIAKALLDRTIAADGDCFIDDTVGGTVGTTDYLDISFNQGVSVGEAWAQLCATGTMDIVLNPIFDPTGRPGKLVEFNVYAEAGSEVDETFGWDTGPNNLTGISRLADGTQRANKVQFLNALGRKIGTLQTDATSVTKFGEYWSIESWPGQNIPAAIDSLAALQLLLRKNGQETVQITPAPEVAPDPYTAYDVGDRVTVEASDRLRKAISGLQRVYGITNAISDDSVEQVDLLTSADQL